MGATRVTSPTRSPSHEGRGVTGGLLLFTAGRIGLFSPNPQVGLGFSARTFKSDWAYSALILTLHASPRRVLLGSPRHHWTVAMHRFYLYLTLYHVAAHPPSSRDRRIYE